MPDLAPKEVEYNYQVVAFNHKYGDCCQLKELKKHKANMVNL